MFILCVHLIQSFYHQLVLDDISQGFTQAYGSFCKKVSEGMVLSCKRQYDLTFHARLESDGYGILCLSLKVCIGRRNHIKKLQKNMKMGTDPVLERLVSYSPTTKKETGKFQVIHYHDCTVYSKNDIDRVSTIILYSTVDRAGLKHCSQVCSMHRWVKDVTRLLSSRNYVGALQLRSKCLYSSLGFSRPSGMGKKL